MMPLFQETRIKMSAAIQRLTFTEVKFYVQIFSIHVLLWRQMVTREPVTSRTPC